MHKLIFLIVFIPVISLSQSTNSTSPFQEPGIKFEVGMTISAAQQKAKEENKLLFIDCYTTWCGPCKRMDADVYSNSKVATYFNENFISVKLQMDRTKKDPEGVKELYSDAKRIEEEYGVISYPTLLFLNQKGEIIYKEVGFKNADEFFNIARGIKKGDSSSQYLLYNLIKKSNKVKLDDSNYTPLLKIANELNDSLLVDSLSNVYYNQLKNRISVWRSYTVDDFEFLQKSLKKSDNDFFKLFKNHGAEIDKKVNQKFFARTVIDRIIKNEETRPSVRAKSENTPNWDSIEKQVTLKYDPEYANRAVLAAKMAFYRDRCYLKHIDSSIYASCWIDLVNKNGKESLLIYKNPMASPTETPAMMIDLTINQFAWDLIFRRSTNEKEINFAIEIMKGVVERSNAANSFWAGASRDTYANLLYKLGEKEKALEIENEALEFAKKDNDSSAIASYNKVISKMGMGIPTWIKSK